MADTDQQGPTVHGYADVAVVIPALNEAKTIGSVIASVGRVCTGAEIIVVDGQSSDGTADAARRVGAHVVVTQRAKGYGRAIKAGLELSSRPIAVMCDGDGTYDLSSLPELIRIVRKGGVGVGCRFRSKPWAMSVIRYIGNTVISLLLRTSGISVVDSQSGLKAFPRTLSKLFVEDGMAFSTEVLLRGRACGLKVTEVATVAYYPRAKGSCSKLRVGRDGLSIIAFIFRESIGMRRF